MFLVKDHSEICEACFARPSKPENRDLLISCDLNTLPSPCGKVLVRVVMDGVSEADGKEAVEIAADTLLRQLVSRLTTLSRRMADQVTKGYEEGRDDAEIQDQLQGWIYDILRDALYAANDALTSSEYPRPYCTVSIAVAFDRYLYSCNLGDSPIYLLNLSTPSAELTSLFRCGNTAGRKVAEGTMTEAEALHCREASQLELFLGCREYDLLDEIYLSRTPLPQSCVLLLGSDGSLAQLPRQEMADAIRNHLDGGLAAVQMELQSLVEESGSTDDFTLVMDRIESD